MAHIRGGRYILNFTVEDINRFFGNASKVGTEVIEGSIERPWNARELILNDLEGIS